MAFKFSPLVFGLLLAVGGTGSAFAQSAPGDVVTNTLNMSYTSGGSTITANNAASVSFTVDRKIDLLVQGLDAGGVVLVDPDQNVAVLSYLIQNKGNGTNGFDIDTSATGTLNMTYDASGTGGKNTYYLVISSNPTPGAGTETIYNAAGLVNAGDLAANAKYYVHVYANIGSAATDLQFKDITVKATALLSGTNTATTEVRGQGLNAIDTIFTDPGFDGREQAIEKYRVKAPVLTASKAVAVISENAAGTFDCAAGTAVVGAEAAIPGACLQYTITVTNGGTATGSATNLSITDKLPTTVSYKSLNKGTFTTVTYATGTATVTATVTSLAPGATASFTVRAQVGS